MSKKKILFIGGSPNQTRMVHAVARHLESEAECFFTPFYTDGILGRLQKHGWMDFCILGGQLRTQTLDFLREQGLPLDEGGRRGGYDLVVTTTDLLVQRNIRKTPLVLIQEGMTDPENILFHLVRAIHLHRYLAGT